LRLIEFETPARRQNVRVTLQNFFVLTATTFQLYAAAVLDLAARSRVQVRRAPAAARKASDRPVRQYRTTNS